MDTQRTAIASSIGLAVAAALAAATPVVAQTTLHAAHHELDLL
jgi:hypothetical protein